MPVEHTPLRYLHEKDVRLQQSSDVQHAVDRVAHVLNTPEARIGVYMDRLGKVFLNGNVEQRRRNMDMLRLDIYRALIITKENFPDSHFELQRRIARECGMGDIEITTDMRNEMIRTAQTEQATSLDAWMDYLTSPDAVYPTWYKYLVWRHITRLGQFDQERRVYQKRTKSTVAPFPEIYHEPLAIVCDKLVEALKHIDAGDVEAKRVLDARFPDLYAEETLRALERKAEAHEGVDGEWVRYVQDTSERYQDEDSDDEPPFGLDGEFFDAKGNWQGGDWDDARKNEYLANPVKLSQAELLSQSLKNKGTDWCTAGLSTARTQLKTGDFYVYYTYGEDGTPTEPRIAIRMEEDRIGEIRGILPRQELEPQLGDILTEKLKEFGDEGARYEKRVNDMRTLTRIDAKTQKNEPLTKEEVRFLWEMDDNIEGFGYVRDPRISALRQERELVQDMHILFPEATDDATLAEKLIDTGSEQCVANNLEKFEGLTAHVAEKLIEAGEGVSVANNLERFAGLNYNEIAQKLIKAGVRDYVAYHLEKFAGLNYNEIAEKLIEAGEGTSVARNLKKFAGLTARVAEKLIEAGEGASVVSNLERFAGLNYNEIAQKLIKAGKGWSVADNLKKFAGLTARVAEKLIEAGEGASVANNLGKFAGLTARAAEQLIEAGEGASVADNLEKFDGLTARVAEQLIEAGKGDYVAYHLERFEGLNYNEIAEKLIEAGERWSVADNLEKFAGLSLNILEQLRRYQK